MDKLIELRKQYKEQKETYDGMKESADMTEVRAKFDELKDLKARIELLQQERDLELEELPNLDKKEQRDLAPEGEIEVRSLTTDQLNEEYEDTFLRAFRNPKNLTQRDREIYDRVAELRAAPNATPYMKSNVDEDGGFIVPHSVSTKINEYKRQGQFNLESLIDVEFTSVLSGEFTYQTLSDAQPMKKLAQWDTITEGETPQFERKSYKIEDYAEIIPLPRTLLQDTDQNLLNVIAKWIAVKTLVTRNAEILAVIDATYEDKKAIADVDDFKDILNVELDPAFYPSAKIVTNEHGFNFLSKLKDEKGVYILQPDPTVADRFNILGKEVVRVTSKTLANDVEGNAPIYVGDFKEAVRLYDRGVYEVTPTMVGGDSFKRNSLDTRIIDRFDVIALDAEAVVAGQIKLVPTP